MKERTAAAIELALAALIWAAFAWACSAPHAEDAPGDDQAREWEPPWGECETVEQLKCPSAGHALTIKSSCVEVAGCTIDGPLVIRAERGATVNDIEPSRTRRDGYVDWLREQAPHHVTVRDCVVTGNGKTSAVFVGAGSSFIELAHLDIAGGGTTQVYFAAESTRVTLRNSTIDDRAGSREAIAIDASDHFQVTKNTIRGSVETYRNCGQDGRTRITTPSDGKISENSIHNADPAIVLGSREGDKWYCLKDYDPDGPGSAASDLDHSRRNVVTGNLTHGGRIIEGKSARGNTIERL